MRKNKKENKIEIDGVQTIDLSQLLQQQRSRTKYTDVLKKIIEELEKEKPKDRLDYCVGLCRIQLAIRFSMSGWDYWLRDVGRPTSANNPFLSMSHLTVDEMKDIFEKMRKITIELLKADLEITTKKEAEVEAKMKEREAKRKRRKKQPKTPYVA